MNTTKSYPLEKKETWKKCTLRAEEKNYKEIVIHVLHFAIKLEKIQSNDILNPGRGQHCRQTQQFSSTKRRERCHKAKQRHWTNVETSFKDYFRAGLIRSKKGARFRARDTTAAVKRLPTGPDKLHRMFKHRSPLFLWRKPKKENLWKRNGSKSLFQADRSATRKPAKQNNNNNNKKVHSTYEFSFQNLKILLTSRTEACMKIRVYNDPAEGLPGKLEFISRHSRNRIWIQIIIVWVEPGKSSDNTWLSDRQTSVIRNQMEITPRITRMYTHDRAHNTGNRVPWVLPSYKTRGHPPWWIPSSQGGQV